MDTAIIITVIICATLFLSLATLLFAAVRVNKRNQVNAQKWIDFTNEIHGRMEGDDDGKL